MKDCAKNIPRNSFPAGLSILLIFFLLAQGTSVAQTTWHVATNGADSGNDGKSWDQPFKTISNAVSQASATLLDTILVSNGTYAITNQITVSKPVTIIGVNGWTNTIVAADCPTHTNRVFYLNHSSAALIGLTITNGDARQYGANWGGGVLIDTAGGSIRDCCISGNIARRGGGVYLNTANGIISNCIIRANISTNDSSYGGGGVCMLNGQLLDCLISHNTDTNLTGGGGVYYGGGLLSGCTIISNNGLQGGGVRSSGTLVISNCNISMNTARSYGGGIYAGGTLSIYGGTINSNNTLASYAAGIYALAINLYGVTIAYNQLDGAGAGLFVTAGNYDVLIDNCDISSNTTFCYSLYQRNGAGILFRGSNLTVLNSRIAGNLVNGASNSAFGAGITLDSNRGNVLIENTAISGNTITNISSGRTADGGGIYMASNTVIRNCAITDNRCSGISGGTGGGICMYAANQNNLIQSSTIAGNYARLSGGGIYMTGNGTDAVWNCVVQSNIYQSGITNWYFGNQARRGYINYTCTPETMTGAGNITSDPQFMSVTAMNYRLAANSLCINAGIIQEWMTGAVDLDGHRRLDRFSGLVDMGCYEYVPVGVMYGLK